MEGDDLQYTTVPISTHPTIPSEQALTHSGLHHIIGDDDPLREIRQKQREEELKNRSFYGLFFWLTCVATFVFLIAIGLLLHYMVAIVLFISLFPPALVITLLITCQKRTNSKIETMMEAYATGVCSVFLIVIIQSIFLSCVGAILAIFGIAISMPFQQPNWNPVEWYNNMISSIPLPFKILSAFLDAFFVASFIEESMKWILSRRLKRRDATAYERYPFAIVSYAACVSVGFAAMENMGYVISFCLPLLSQPASSGAIFWSGMVVVLGRSLTAVPMHVMTGSLIGCSLANSFIFEHAEGNGFVQYVKMIWFPVLIHGSYDFFVFLADMLEAKYGLPCFGLAFVILCIALIVLIIQWKRISWKLNSGNTKDSIEQRPLMKEEHFIAEEDEQSV